MKRHSDDILVLLGAVCITYALYGMWRPLAPLFVGVVCILAGVLFRPKAN